MLIIGVGNTAMDCCRTSRRLGGTDVKVIARRGRKYFKASPWELEDAEEEGVHIVENHAPKRFVVENGKLVGMEMDVLRWTEKNGKQKSEVIDTVMLPCDDVILAIGQENAFPWIERDVGLDFDKHGMPVVDRTTMMSTKPGVFFGGDAAWGPENIIWAVEHGHQAAISINNHCQGASLTERPAYGMNLVSSKVGMHSWSYSNDYSSAQRMKMKHEDLTKRFKGLGVEVELGSRRADGGRGAAVPQLRRADELHGEPLHRVRRVHRRLPGELPDDHSRGRGGHRHPPAPLGAGDELDAGHLLVRAAPADEADHGEGRGRLPALRPVRRALPDGRVGHEQVRAADSICGLGQHRGRRMSAINDFAFKIGDGQRDGSASANGLLMQAIFRMGIPVTGKNVFPSNIQGLPTWYEIRVSKDGYTARPDEVDLVVALNSGDVRKDVAAVRPGGYLLYDSSWPLDDELVREGITILGIPFGKLCVENFEGDRDRTLLRNIVYAGALAALLEIDMDVVGEMLREKFSKKRALLDANNPRSGSATTTRRRTTIVRCPSI